MLVEVWITTTIIGFAFLLAGLLYPDTSKKALIMLFSIPFFVINAYSSFNIQKVVNITLESYVYDELGLLFAALCMVVAGLAIGFTLFGVSEE